VRTWTRSAECSAERCSARLVSPAAAAPTSNGGTDQFSFDGISPCTISSECNVFRSAKLLQTPKIPTPRIITRSHKRVSLKRICDVRSRTAFLFCFFSPLRLAETNEVALIFVWPQLLYLWLNQENHKKIGEILLKSVNFENPWISTGNYRETRWRYKSRDSDTFVS